MSGPQLKKAESIFDELVDMPSGQRGPLLTERCGHDQQLRAFVEELLADHDRGLGDFLRCPALPVAGAPQPEPVGRIGPYRLLRRLGEGGFGEVHLAEQTDPVDREVALKIVKLGMDTKQVVARFEAERQALALMDHPNIAKVFEAGATERGRPFFAMEYVTGTRITDYCDEQQLGMEERLGLFIDVCEAIQHAHQKGIIHRDLKPSNVLVEHLGDRHVAKVIDFGIAKAIGFSLTERTLVTEQGQLIGTPEYMSPEQAAMSAANVDTRTDIYALGALLYELIAGALPFDPQTFRGKGLDEIQRIIREVEPPKPSTRLSTMDGETAADKDSSIAAIAIHRRTDPRALRRRLRGDLDWITMRAMDKQPTRRYATVSELAADIRRHLGHEPVAAGPPSSIYKLRKLIRRHKVGVTAATLLIFVFLAGAAATTWQAFRATDAERLAAAVNDFLRNDVLASISPWQGGEPTVNTMLEEASSRIEGRFEGEPRIEASIRVTLGAAYRDLGKYEAAEQHVIKGHELLQAALGDEHRETIDAKYNLAEVLWRQGRFEDADRWLDESLTLARRVLGADDRLTLMIMRRLGYVLREQGHYNRAESMLVETLQRQRRALGEADMHTSATMGTLAGVYMAQNRLREAEQLRVRALEIRRQLVGDEHAATAEGFSTLGRLYRLQGRYAEAEQMLLTALGIRRRLLGDDHHATTWSRTNLGLVYLDEGRYAEAEVIFTGLLELRERILGPEHRQTASSVDALGSVYLAQGRLAEAEPLLQRALQMRRSDLGEEHQYTLWSTGDLGSLYVAQGRFEEAGELFADLLGRQRRLFGDGHPDIAPSLSELGAVREAQGRYAEAEHLLTQALEVNRHAYHAGHPATLASMDRLASFLGRSDPQRLEEAETLARDACAGAGDLLGPRNLHTIRYRDTLGVILTRAARLDEATALLRDLASGASEALGDDHRLTVLVRAHLGACLVKAGHLLEAEALLLETLPRLQSMEGGDREVEAVLRSLEELQERGIESLRPHVLPQPPGPGSPP
ncbi:MAG: tetratricopeptide repeat protein [Planctomycetota bacterium]|jgi:serine/threonine protein kinase/tetratricopeptide (TPR) repeat protein